MAKGILCSLHPTPCWSRLHPMVLLWTRDSKPLTLQYQGVSQDSLPSQNACQVSSSLFLRVNQWNDIRPIDTTFYWNEESGSFTSPNYPGNYSDNTYWQWQVWTPPGSTVRLQFHQFATERSCDRILVWTDATELDWLLKFILFQVYKNWPDLANLLLVHSGHGIPPAVDSPSNEMTVVFETDYSVVSSGFSATFQALYEPTPGTWIQILANVV